MKTSWKIGSVFGIAVRIHATFPLLLLWVAAKEYAERNRWADVGTGLGFAIVLFASVVMHELGHALAAKRYGIRTRDITLLPIGGVARLEKIPTVPLQELWIALAGPAVSLALGLIFFLAVTAPGITAGTEIAVLEESFLARLGMVNVILAIFNLIPAFPMDGGRVLRALLALRLDYVRATHIAAQAGKSFAMGLGIAGLISNPILLLIAVFVWFGADQENAATRLRAAFAGVPVEDVMITEFHVLSPEDELQRGVDFVRASRQQDFPVLQDRAVVGMLGWDDLIAGLSSIGPRGRVGDIMQRRVQTVPCTALVERVLDRAGDDDFRTLPVTRAGCVVGLFTSENLLESMILKDASARVVGGTERNFVGKGGEQNPPRKSQGRRSAPGAAALR
jgi:Zn-dependent protease/predicted transcriptional regulator